MSLDLPSSLAAFYARCLAKHWSSVWPERPQKEHSICLLPVEDGWLPFLEDSLDEEEGGFPFDVPLPLACPRKAKSFFEEDL